MQYWELFGDGREIVSNNIRCALIYQLLSKFGFLSSMGTAKSIARFFYENAYRLSDRTNHESDPDQERTNITELFDAYMKVLEDHGFTEPSVHFENLSQRMPSRNMIISEEFAMQEPWNELYTNVLGLKAPERDDTPSFSSLDILVATGKTAVIPQAAHQLERSFEEGSKDAIWYSEDPLRTYQALHSMGVCKDKCVSLIADIPIQQTKFGKLMFALFDLVKGDKLQDCLALATDILMSPYCSATVVISDENIGDGGKIISKDAMNKNWRMNRTLTSADLLECLKTYSQEVADAIDLFISPSEEDVRKLLARLRYMTTSLFSGQAQEIEAAAIDRFRETLLMLLQLEASEDVIWKVILDSTFRISISSIVEDDPDALCADDRKELIIASLSYADEVGPDSFDIALVDDVSTQSYAADESLGYLDLLAESLGAPRTLTSAQTVENNFLRAVKSAKDGVVLCFSKKDVAGKEAFTSFAFDRFMESLLGKSISIEAMIDSSASELHGLTGIGDLRIQVQVFDESDLNAGICWKSDDANIKSLGAFVERASLTGLADAMLLQQIDAGMGYKPRLSASAIEAYMSCPYEWFFVRRLGVSPFDEGFGPLERGTFAHAVLEDFYEQVIGGLQEGTKICDIPASKMQAIFDASFEKIAQEQHDMAPGSGRFIPLTKLENIEMSALKAQMLSAVLALMQLPSDYVPMAMEKEVDPSNPAEVLPVYAGAYIKGKIDRIDVDRSQKRFYVLDYKGSIADHSAGSSSFEPVGSSKIADAQECVVDAEDHASDSLSLSKLDPSVYPSHVQTLIYAQLQRRSMQSIHDEMKPVAAVYASYKSTGTKGIISGSIQSTEQDLVAFSDGSSQVAGSFENFLDKVEDLISDHVTSMQHHVIANRPHTPEVCRYCPYLWCESRC